ncbi:sulfurtransferase complex subunit TusB [Aeromonas schubertii]|uniref:Intracellular sulfur oxidation protein DsrH n=1 Tax=Aeromonas schubertii TaxID=652 RepID=A0A0S2SJ47_9GAMM|nr:sulfurtransferase complex subunit TusB [Aeromonas schubertii]ALP41728.1 Intracellular sulfur oxidation protein DsrH [Aeromonas schubertii]
MLHLVMSSPFASRSLEQCLAHRTAGDPVVLLQDGVIAACTQTWLSRLQGVPLYVLQEDLQARGLSALEGQSISMGGLVDLIAEYGSPLSWGE